jgi:NAD(P)H-hydrate repair Nnr-like enzyme with NAD(P)H-hydrate dehydratase domain
LASKFKASASITRSKSILINVGQMLFAYPLIEAAEQGVYRHGLAADKVAANKGERGLCASDVVDYLIQVVNWVRLT